MQTTDGERAEEEQEETESDQVRFVQISINGEKMNLIGGLCAIGIGKCSKSEEFVAVRSVRLTASSNMPCVSNVPRLEKGSRSRNTKVIE